MASSSLDWPSETILSCDNLYKSFTNGRRKIEVLQGVSLQLQRGAIYLISGPSGSGKSTLLSLLGLLDRPSSGTVFWKGCNLSGCSESELSSYRRHEFGYVFQDAGLLPSWTALENVEAPLMHTDISEAARKEKASFLLDSLGLKERMHHLPGELSAGQKQRVAIARALAAHPSVILADEPTGNVDPDTAYEITQYLDRLVIQEQMTLLVVTHGNFHIESNHFSWYLKNGQLTEDKPRVVWGNRKDDIHGF